MNNKISKKDLAILRESKRLLQEARVKDIIWKTARLVGNEETALRLLKEVMEGIEAEIVIFGESM